VLPSQPSARTRRARGGVALVALASLLAVGLVGQPATGARDHHGLHTRKHTLDSRINRGKADVDEVSANLLHAKARLDVAVAQLADARARLSGLGSQVRTAARVDSELQVRLDQAVVRLDSARSDLARSKVEVATKRSELTGYAVSSYSSGGVETSGLGVALSSGTAQQAVDGLQDVDTVLDKQAVDVQQLQALQVLLGLTEQRVQATTDDVAAQRSAAAKNLALKRLLEARAATAKRQVAARVAHLHADRERLVAAKRSDIRRLGDLRAERRRIGQRLRQVAERRAREHHTTLSATPTPTVTRNDGGYLSYPVKNTYITSPYGMRMNPVIHVYELHDGTDFHAVCGTPVYAAARGRVTEEYFNIGYGNRLLMDNGYVHGVSLATSYNHLTSYVAGVGQRVARGQLIAYSGTTGFSTGCHLHFMVYVNGATVDPMTWL
jgi:murein DD-endopeptidase MepM/ murein hydrolase activator NlpD